MRDRLRHRPHIRPKVYGHLTEEKESLRQGFAALFLSSVGELIAGLALASITETLDQIVGLAVLIPAAIGMRGAIFGMNSSPTCPRIDPAAVPVPPFVSQTLCSPATGV